MRFKFKETDEPKDYVEVGFPGFGDDQNMSGPMSIVFIHAPVAARTHRILKHTMTKNLALTIEDIFNDIRNETPSAQFIPYYIEDRRDDYTVRFGVFELPEGWTVSNISDMVAVYKDKMEKYFNDPQS